MLICDKNIGIYFWDMLICVILPKRLNSSFLGPTKKGEGRTQGEGEAEVAMLAASSSALGTCTTRVQLFLATHPRFIPPVLTRRKKNTVLPPYTEPKIRAALKEVVPADLKKKKLFEVASILRRIANEYDGGSGAATPVVSKKATRKVKERAGDAVVGLTDDELEAGRSKAVQGSRVNSVEGTEDGDEEELVVAKGGRGAYRKEGPPLGCCMADPQSPKRMMWDFLVIMPLLAYLTIMMPFRMCFGNGAIKLSRVSPHHAPSIMCSSCDISWHGFPISGLLHPGRLAPG